MKLILALIFVVLTTVVYANPLAEDFADGEKSEGNVQLNDDAKELSDDDDDESLEDDDDDDDNDYNENDAYARRGRKPVGKSTVEFKKFRVNCHCESLLRSSELM